MYEEINEAIVEIQQPRSKFQLERFVLGQHATPEMQYYQTVLELQSMLHAYKINELEQKRLELKIAKLREKNDEISELKAQQYELNLEQLTLTMFGAKREIDHLVNLFNSFPKKYTREEIENAQPEYWYRRLTNNAKAMLMSGNAVNPAHIEAMEQAGILQGFMAEVEEERKQIQ